MFRRSVRMGVVVAALLSFVGLTHPTRVEASDAGSAEGVALVNQARADNGLPALREVGDLDAVAVAHAQDMAAQNRLFHNPNLGTDVTGWQVVAENVGVGGSLAQVEDAFLQSPRHRANILNGVVTEVGVGVVQDANGTWVVQVFRQPAAAPAPAPPPAPAPAPIRAASAAPARPAASPSTPTTAVPPPPTTEPPTTEPPVPTTEPAPADPLDASALVPLPTFSEGELVSHVSPAAPARPSTHSQDLARIATVLIAAYAAIRAGARVRSLLPMEGAGRRRRRSSTEPG